MTDRDASSESAEPRGTLPGSDKLLSWVCTLWLLNAATGAAVAIREDLPGELIADVFTGRDASAEFFKARARRSPPDSPTSPRRQSSLY